MLASSREMTVRRGMHGKTPRGSGESVARQKRHWADRRRAQPLGVNLAIKISACSPPAEAADRCIKITRSYWHVYPGSRKVTLSSRSSFTA